MYQALKNLMTTRFVQPQIQNKLVRACTTSNVSESTLTELLKKRFPEAKEIKVADVSGGCGAMFEISVISSEFKGLSIVKQHKAITDTLKEQIKQIHGLRIDTKIAT